MKEPRMADFEALEFLRGTEAWEVIKAEVIENVIKREQETIMAPLDSPQQIYAAERAKGAIEALRSFVAAVEIEHQPTEESSDAPD